MPGPDADFLRGTLDALILKTLSWGPRHGYAIVRWLEDSSRETLRIAEGSMYPALYRMELRGWIEASWGMSELGRRAKFYALTSKGKARLRAEVTAWRRLSGAVGRILEARSQEGAA